KTNSIRLFRVAHPRAARGPPTATVGGRESGRVQINWGLYPGRRGRGSSVVNRSTRATVAGLSPPGDAFGRNAGRRSRRRSRAAGSPAEAVLHEDVVRVEAGAGRLDEVAGEQVRVLDQEVLVVGQVEVQRHVDLVADVVARPAGRVAPDRRA